MMNDTELDELLNSWEAPATPPSWRERVRSAIPTRTALPERTTSSWRRWRLWLAAASVATFVVAILLSNTNAFPTPVIHPPFTVDSEIVRYDEGSIIERGPKMLQITSFNQDGSEVILAWSAALDPFDLFMWNTSLTVRETIGKIHRQFRWAPEQLAQRQEEAILYPAMIGESWSLGNRTKLILSGCTRQKNVVAQEIILGYPTKAIQHKITSDRVLTLWMAPDLSCFALRARIEVQQPDGAVKLISEKKAIRVTVNR